MRAMMVAMEDHRSSKFPELTMSLFQQLKKVFKSETGQPFIFSGSGTGAGEGFRLKVQAPKRSPVAL
jgi:alanine-glyoxylate transaminase/serine-glyoxylate transaminase/serine-pyruvate transaminase